MSELVDYDRAWLHLKAYIATKRNHGAAELTEVMARLEVESMYPERGDAAAPDSSGKTDAEHLESAAAEAPADPTPGDNPTTPEEASWKPTSAPTAPTTSRPLSRA